MRVKIRISIINAEGKAFMGIGILELLRGVERYRSIRKAAVEMRMSYAKAHRILKELERNVGHDILDRQIGGISGGGARLTDFGKFFLDRYEEFVKNSEGYVNREFQKFLNSID